MKTDAKRTLSEIRVQSTANKQKAWDIYFKHNGELSMKELGALIGVTEEAASRYISEYFQSLKTR
jgi:hypothetical protein